MTDFDNRIGLEANYKPPVRTYADGVPVYNFGYSSCYSESPTLVDDKIVQVNNNNTGVKIHPKKSWEIKNNRIGTCPPRLPCNTSNDYQPVEAVNLIDGSDTTCWASLPSVRPNVGQDWIRIDLARERTVHKIVLRKRKITHDRSLKPGSFRPYPNAEEAGRAMPLNLTIKLSQDALEWNTIFDGETLDTPEKDCFIVEFESCKCKQVLISGNVLVLCEVWMYAFSIASVELYDENDRNVALVSNGSGVTVSSTHHNEGNEREVRQWYWGMQFDLGLKWTRVGFHDDLINWHWVEKEKGVLQVDEEAEKGIRVLAENGVNVIFSLGFGNRFYQEDPKRYFPQLWEMYFENPEPPKSDEAIEGWCRYVRFCVERFKDSVACFEIWNEWNADVYWGDTADLYHYIKIARITIPIIRECAPDAKIMLGSFAGFCHGISKWSSEELDNMVKTHPFLMAVTEFAKEVDIIGFHPLYQADILIDQYVDYADSVKAFRNYCESIGYKGEYMATEYGYGANYPATEGDWWGYRKYTEIEKAKIIAQIDTIHTSQYVGSFFCGMFTTTYPLDISLLRRTVVSSPITCCNPQAAYYTRRNLATAFEDLIPASFNCEIDGDISEFMLCPMQRESEQVLAIWLKGNILDDCEGKVQTLTFEFEAKTASAYNPLTGEETPLNVTNNGKKTVLSGIVIRDYPLIIRLDI